MCMCSRSINIIGYDPKLERKIQDDFVYLPHPCPASKNSFEMAEFLNLLLYYRTQHQVLGLPF